MVARCFRHDVLPQGSGTDIPFGTCLPILSDGWTERKNHLLVNCGKAPSARRERDGLDTDPRDPCRPGRGRSASIARRRPAHLRFDDRATRAGGQDASAGQLPPAALISSRLGYAALFPAAGLDRLNASELQSLGGTSVLPGRTRLISFGSMEAFLRNRGWASGSGCGGLRHFGVLARGAGNSQGPEEVRHVGSRQRHRLGDFRRSGRASRCRDAAQGRTASAATLDDALAQGQRALRPEAWRGL